MNSLKRVRAFQIELELIWKCWFLRRGENGIPQEKTSRSKGENQQQFLPTDGVDARIGTRATRVEAEASALTNATPLLLPYT